jgi:hypothetical protein
LTQRVPSGYSSIAACWGFGIGWNEVRAEKKQRVEIVQNHLVKELLHAKMGENQLLAV